MPYVTYRGSNSSIMLYGIRFPEKVPVLVSLDKVIGELRTHPHFEIDEAKNIPLEDLTVIQLKDKAKLAGIDGYADMKKAELIAALKVNMVEGTDGKDANSNNSPTA